MLRWVRPVRASLMASEGSFMKWKVSFAGGNFVWVSVAMFLCFEQLVELGITRKWTVDNKWKTVLLKLKASGTRADRIHERDTNESLQEYLDLALAIGLLTAAYHIQ